ncbi:collagen alpha-1(I) chain-like [Zalophus californianus]|uniref:Collagen alpha-1(I) chain-like n=1 Tax=Zalophus californianus TaxID=9704 RepID=A0A6J2FI87_ZALCA|nr:collagen alpha-1(I) chain-like [Zalophus californianus]
MSETPATSTGAAAGREGLKPKWASQGQRQWGSGAGAGERKGVVYATKGAGEKTRSGEPGEPGEPQKCRAPCRSPPHPPWSPPERENSLKRAGARPRVGGGGGRGPQGVRLVQRAPSPGPPAASAPPPLSPYLQRPAPPLPRSLGSGETAAGAWERAAPAGVGLRRRGSRGTAGPWEPGTRKRRAAEVGEGRRRAPALASLPAALGSPLGRGRSHFQARGKVPGAHPCPAAGRARPHSARCRGARLRTLRSTCCAALGSASPPRGHARVVDPRALAAGDSRAAPPQRTRTLGEKAQRGRGPGGAGRALTRCRASGQVRRGGGPP